VEFKLYNQGTRGKAKTETGQVTQQAHKSIVCKESAICEHVGLIIDLFTPSITKSCLVNLFISNDNQSNRFFNGGASPLRKLVEYKSITLVMPFNKKMSKAAFKGVIGGLLLIVFPPLAAYLFVVRLFTRVLTCACSDSLVFRNTTKTKMKTTRCSLDNLLSCSVIVLIILFREGLAMCAIVGGTIILTILGWLPVRRKSDLLVQPYLVWCVRGYCIVDIGFTAQVNERSSDQESQDC